MPALPEPSKLVTLLHLALSGLLAVRLVQGVANAGANLGEPTRAWLGRARNFGLGLALWLAASYALARWGVLRGSEEHGPRILFLLAPGLALCALLAFTSFGALLVRGLPLWVLIGFQLFRVPVELLLWRLHQEGILPEQMTFAGSNFDVITGATALPVAWLHARGRLPRWGLWLWNLGGLALLVNIVVIALRSMPGPLRAYAEGPANTVVLDGIFVWIPAFYVLTAWSGHMLVLRALLRPR